MLGKGLLLWVPAPGKYVIPDILGSLTPGPEVFGITQLFGNFNPPVQGYPAQEFGVNKVIGTASYFPDAAVGLPPEVSGGIDEAHQQFPVMMSDIAGNIKIIIGRLKHLAKNIQLALLVGIVADAYRPGIAIAFEMVEYPFIRRVSEINIV